MSTEYDIRVERAFGVEQLRAAAEELLGQILPGIAPVTLRVTRSSVAFHGRYSEAPTAAAELLEAIHGGGSPLVPSYLLVTHDGEAVAEVSEYDFGGYEDPDGGRRLLVSRHYYREPASRVLGIAVASAAAQLTGSPVVDEYEVLTGERLATPTAVIERLHNPAATGTLAEAASQSLSTAGIT